MAVGTVRADRNSRRNVRRALSRSRPVRSRTNAQGYRRAVSSGRGRSSGS